MKFKLKNHNWTLAFTIVIIISLALISSNENFPKFFSDRYGPTQNVRCHHDKAPRFRYHNESAPQGKQFVYMYNVADCLPLDLLTKDTLLDGTNRDILVLSYSSRCKRKDPSHVHVYWK